MHEVYFSKVAEHDSYDSQTRVALVIFSKESRARRPDNPFVQRSDPSQQRDSHTRFAVPTIRTRVARAKISKGSQIGRSEQLHLQRSAPSGRLSSPCAFRVQRDSVFWWLNCVATKVYCLNFGDET